jgi:hypothetical protein
MNYRKIHARAAAYAVLLTAFCGGVANAQDGEQANDDGEAGIAKMCLDNPTIKRTRILNDRNIVFITRDDRIYNNQLPRQCPSLRRNSLVNYAIAHRQLCAGGQFQVLWQTGTGNYTPAFTCQLGTFVPITEGELEDLTAMTDEDRETRRARRRSTREAVTSEEVELPPRAEPEPAPTAPTE